MKRIYSDKEYLYHYVNVHEYLIEMIDGAECEIDSNFDCVVEHLTALKELYHAYWEEKRLNNE